MKLASASSLSIKGIDWLWYGRVPCGAVTLVEGDPGTSKSTLTATMAAHVSQGRNWPDGSPCPKGHAIIANAEDPEEEIILPRLVAAEADLDNVSIIVPSDKTDTSIFTIPDHVSNLKQEILDRNVRIVVFDPLEAFLSVKVNNYSNHHVRQALRSLEQMAKEVNCAVVIVRHLNKDAGKSPIYRGGGSIGIIGAARASMLVLKDPANKMRCLVVPNKSNWAALKNGLAYKTTTTDLTAPTGEVVQTSRIVWDGEVDISAAEALQPAIDLETSVDLEEAASFLRTTLADGARYSTDIFAEAAKQGLNKKVISNAAKMVNVIKFPEGHGSAQRWLWELEADIDSDFLKGV